MKYTPAFDKILVRVTEEQYDGALIIPDSVKKNPPIEGEVISWGPDVSEFAAKNGLAVVFGKYSGHDIPDLKNVQVIAEGDIWYKKENNNGSGPKD